MDANRCRMIQQIALKQTGVLMGIFTIQPDACTCTKRLAMNKITFTRWLAFPTVIGVVPAVTALEKPSTAGTRSAPACGGCRPPVALSLSLSVLGRSTSSPQGILQYESTPKSRESRDSRCRRKTHAQITRPNLKPPRVYPPVRFGRLMYMTCLFKSHMCHSTVTVATERQRESCAANLNFAMAEELSSSVPIDRKNTCSRRR